MKLYLYNWTNNKAEKFCLNEIVGFDKWSQFISYSTSCCEAEQKRRKVIVRASDAMRQGTRNEWEKVKLVKILKKTCKLVNVEINFSSFIVVRNKMM